jgi:4-amino-4-deoxy-L-arabinose transferase-like glycosyltransferase
LLIALTALTLRAAWAVLMVDRAPRFDEIAYVGHARRLLAGLGFVDAHGQPASYWPIGYPAALALTYYIAGESYWSAVVLNVVCGAATAVVAFLLARSLLGPSTALMAGLVVAAYPNHVFYSSLQLTEPLFTLVVVGMTFLILRWPTALRSAAAAGVLLGVAALTRPAIVLFPLVLPVWYVRLGNGLRAAITRAGVVALMLVVIVTPWILRNHRVSGGWELASSSGDNFWRGNNPEALGGYARSREMERALIAGEGRDASRGYRLGLAAMASEPGKAALRAAQKVSYFFALETDGLLWNLKGLQRPWPTWTTVLLLGLANAMYLAVLSGCVLALVSGAGGPVGSLCGLLTVYLVAVSIVFLGDPRYHYPLVPFAAIVATKAALEELPALWAGLRSSQRSAYVRAGRWAAITSMFVTLMIANLYLKTLESGGSAR